ncbi:probable sodium/metabolite cotransporter BASS2, chloroplastic [Pistacia vera]|uniref:probable sodium/metabolite cotransporter BASS2, chloroplastic n=1 Tax=Pistacia vera TaxID=55513 RepID=UPI00126321E2|nr:probable sodium/metabolite cotransporter BASS2, chloroplastic [Pistacia vera]
MHATMPKGRPFIFYFNEVVLQVTLIAQGDVPLSIVMTMCTTLGAVLLTPLLTKILAGTYVPIDAVKLSISTLQVVVAPVLLGSYMQSTFPYAAKVLTPFAPLFAVLASSLLACSVFTENVVRLKSSVVAASLASDLSPISSIQSILSGELGVVMLSVVLLHFTGFFVGYLAAAAGGFKEQQRRVISIELILDHSLLVNRERKLLESIVLEIQRTLMESNGDGRHAKFFLGCGFSNRSFHFINGCVAPSLVCGDYEHHGQLFGIHLEIY